MTVTAPAVLAELPNGGRGWMVHPVVFSRSGIAADALRVLRQHDGTHVPLANLERDLREPAI
jgi:hypothetical protein